MRTDLLAMEHYRFHVIEQWPEGAQKEAALAAVRSAIDSVLRLDPDGTAGWSCMVCGRRTAQFSEGRRTADRSWLKAAA
jgi:uncharacterized protein YggL (DUF469 family)